MKKTLAFLLVMVMVLGMLPTVAFAAETDVLPNHLHAELPAQVTADLAAAGLNTDYVYDWATENFITSSTQGVTTVDDSDALLGKAAKYDGTGTSYAGKQWYFGYSTGGAPLRPAPGCFLTAATTLALAGKIRNANPKNLTRNREVFWVR